MPRLPSSSSLRVCGVPESLPAGAVVTLGLPNAKLPCIPAQYPMATPARVRALIQHAMPQPRSAFTLNAKVAALRKKNLDDEDVVSTLARAFRGGYPPRRELH